MSPEIQQMWVDSREDHKFFVTSFLDAVKPFPDDAAKLAGLTKVVCHALTTVRNNQDNLTGAITVSNTPEAVSAHFHGKMSTTDKQNKTESHEQEEQVDIRDGDAVPGSTRSSSSVVDSANSMQHAVK